MRTRVILAPAIAAALVGLASLEAAVPRISVLRDAIFGSPHQRYAARLTLTRASSPDSTEWLHAARRALDRAPAASLPARQDLAFAAARPSAAAFAVRLRPGQRYVVEAHVRRGDPSALFVDVFERDGADLSRRVSAAPDERRVTLEPASDAEYLVRVQPELDRTVEVTLSLRAEPTLRLPVEGARRSAIQSFFGDARDGGRRSHHGIDIFAPHGTPVVAAASGIVSAVRISRLGGNVVWIARPMRGEAHYYAHLDRQLVKAGAFVRAGDVIGTVGNTGNARRTPPHLHFGIYAPRGAVDPLPYVASPPERRAVSAATARTPTSRRHDAD